MSNQNIGKWVKAIYPTTFVTHGTLIEETPTHYCIEDGHGNIHEIPKEGCRIEPQPELRVKK